MIKKCNVGVYQVHVSAFYNSHMLVVVGACKTIVNACLIKNNVSFLNSNNLDLLQFFSSP